MSNQNGKGRKPCAGYNAKKWYENWDDVFHPRKLLPLSAHPYPPPCPFDDPIIAHTPEPLGRMHAGFICCPYIPEGLPPLSSIKFSIIKGKFSFVK